MNIHIDQLLDIAYQMAKEHYKEKQFTFNMIWSKTWKAAQQFKKEPVEDWIGIFYTSLQLDTRFVKYPNNNMALREFINYTEHKKLEKSIYSDDGLLEDDDDEIEKIEKPITTTTKKGRGKAAATQTYNIDSEFDSTSDDKEEVKNLIDSEI